MIMAVDNKDQSSHSFWKRSWIYLTVCIKYWREKPSYCRIRIYYRSI